MQPEYTRQNCSRSNKQPPYIGRYAGVFDCAFRVSNWATIDTTSGSPPSHTGGASTRGRWSVFILTLRKEPCAIDVAALGPADTAPRLSKQSKKPQASTEVPADQRPLSASLDWSSRLSWRPRQQKAPGHPPTRLGYSLTCYTWSGRWTKLFRVLRGGCFFSRGSVYIARSTSKADSHRGQKTISPTTDCHCGSARQQGREEARR